MQHASMSPADLHVDAVVTSIMHTFPRFPKDVNPFDQDQKDCVERWLDEVAACMLGCVRYSGPMNSRQLRRIVAMCNLISRMVRNHLWPTIDRSSALQALEDTKAAALESLCHPFFVNGKRKQLNQGVEGDDSCCCYFFQAAEEDLSTMLAHLGWDNNDDMEINEIFGT